tara:strand:- start:61 stop:975 length:915 start_codon:yes stop_codon:yes gene_type:complete
VHRNLSNNTRTYLIIGSEGFIGSKACIYLANSGNPIYAIDIPKAKGKSPYSNSINNHPMIKAVYLDNLSEINFQDLTDEVTIIYTVALSNHLLEKNNLSKGTIPDLKLISDLIEALPEGLNPDISYLSSSAVYGPITGVINEVAETKAENPYSYMKLASESMLSYYSKVMDLNIRVFRLFTPYGAYQNKINLIGKLWQSKSDKLPIRLFKRGSQIRDFIYIDDIAHALGITNYPNGFSIYNLGGPESTSFRTFAERIGANFSLEGEETEEDFILSDTSKIFKDTGWKPSIKLDEGIKLTLSHST